MADTEFDETTPMGRLAQAEKEFSEHAREYPEARNSEIPCGVRSRRNYAYAKYTKTPHPSTLPRNGHRLDILVLPVGNNGPTSFVGSYALLAAEDHVHNSEGYCIKNRYGARCN